MKRVLLLLLIAASLSAEAQPFNNEWIDYNKTYYKFKVGANGVYRIRQATLISMGINVSTNADHFQLWRNGQQIPLYTTVQNAPLGASDYIEFWGEMNDGKPDHVMYRESDSQLNDKWSLQTDSAAFFLTVNPSGGNLRLQTTPNNVSTNILPVEPWFMYTEGKYFKDKQHAGRAELVGDAYTYSSSYDRGEGWTSIDIGTGSSVPFVTTPLYPYLGGNAPPPVIKVNAAGNAVHARDFKVTLNGDSIFTASVNYFDLVRASKEVTAAQINTGTANIVVHNMCIDPNDRLMVAQIELLYPRVFNFGGSFGFTFELPANAQGNYLEIGNFAHAGTPPVLYDLTNGKRYVGDISNPSLVKVALLPSVTNRKLVLVSEMPSNIRDIPASIVETRNFVNYGLAANQGDYLIITSSVLTSTPVTADNPVEDYRQYRSSAQGGGYNAKVYLIDQLNDQFGLGIKMHPLSIRNFIRWARANYSDPLKYILIIGKGVVFTQFRALEAVPDMYKLCLVPTFGYPASDMLLSAEGSSSIPLTPIGRISAINKSEIKVYLDKVKEYELLQQTFSSPAIADMAWRKNVVHVTGASDDVTTDILQMANEGFRKIIEDTMYGAKVYSFTKNSSEAVQQLSSGQLAGIFENGLGLLTYFGHSSASTLEFNLDNPQNYNNPGKYPTMIVMGCNAGNFFTYNAARFVTKETISEKYVLAPQRGAIAFLASTHLGIVHYLDIYNTRLYRAMSFKKYGETIGNQMIEAIRATFANTTENDFYARFQCEEFLLHGDPALHVYSLPKPDYAIEEQLVKASPSFISVADTVFQLKAAFMNLRKAPDSTIVIELRRTFPNYTSEIRRDTIPGIRYIDSIIYDIPIISTRDKGLNTFTITVDADNTVDEEYETNNTISKDVYIFEDEVRPVYPYNFSIVNEQNARYVASTANAFAEMRSYLMEIDTTELFNSPSKVSTSTSSAGGVFEFNVPYPFTDSTVYYWRVAPVNPVGEPTWNVSSFIYIDGPDQGFSQSHLYQHFKSARTKIKLDSTTRKWSFSTKDNFIFARGGVYPHTSPDGAYYVGTINDVEGIIQPGCNYDELMINVIDPVTFKAWGNPGLYNSISCRPYNFQYLLADTFWRGNAMRFLENIVPDGHIVMIRNNANPNAGLNTYASTWKNDEAFWGAGNSLYHTLYNQGFTGIDSMYRPRSFMMIYKKNRPNEFTPYWAVSEGTYDGITASATFSAPDSIGYIASPVFGPAKAWYQLKWRGKSEDIDPAIDNPTIDVVGVSNTGAETVLFPAVNVSQQDVDVSSVDVAQYPYLKLRMRNVDTLYHSAYQLRYWMLTYDPVPEGAIAPNLYFTTKDTVEVGEPFNFGIGFKNVSKVDFDSVKVKITVTDSRNYENVVPVSKQKPLLPNDTIRLNATIDTRSLSGPSVIFVKFNPDFDQPEHYLTNNFAFRNLYVRPDSMSPIMDVTFDGVHILNRDIVSSEPDILIKLRDEARWMRLDDTSSVIIEVRYPGGGPAQRMYFGSPTGNDTLEFIPAGSTSNAANVASIRFNPHLYQDGEYELIISGKDKSGNTAGAVAYRVAFQVINKPMISNMLNYPNPFTTSTAFVFTITGSQVPQNIRIQILTITGKVVREITKDELGPLHVGRNITEFKWDGTDQYGDKLANGVYLYRVITNLNGRSLDKYKASGDNTDKYFNNGYGKMYLMR